MKKLFKLSSQQLCGIQLLIFVIVGEVTGLMKNQPAATSYYVFPILLNVIGGYWICGSLWKTPLFLAPLYSILVLVMIALPNLSIWISSYEGLIHIFAYLATFALFIVLISGVLALLFGLWNWAFTSGVKTVQQMPAAEGIDL